MNLHLSYFFTDCVYKGQYYTRGEIFDKGDNCNSCKCMADGTIQCSEKQCFPGNSNIQKSYISFIWSIEHNVILTNEIDIIIPFYKEKMIERFDPMISST